MGGGHDRLLADGLLRRRSFICGTWRRYLLRVRVRHYLCLLVLLELKGRKVYWFCAIWLSCLDLSAVLEDSDILLL